MASSYYHAAADFPPEPGSAFALLRHNEECVIILKTGERFNARWIEGAYRFGINGQSRKVSRDDVDEWWSLSTSPKLPRK